ncbi:MAG: hypothetical protein RI935_139 [Candidatus Parcubacteria bacterium]|jgi:hypothetical protein
MPTTDSLFYITMDILQSLLTLIHTLLSLVYGAIPSPEVAGSVLENIVATTTKKLPEELQTVVEVAETAQGIIQKVQQYEALLP